ncbi:hypothetical protein ASPNIDRAFT_133712, partial [Aspergillus niger ATCC 1015]
LHEYSTGEVGWATGIYLLLSYFFNIVISPICDSYRPMILGPIGGCTTVLSFILLAECQTYWQFMLCLGVFGAMSGATLATTVSPCQLGWKWSMRIMALVIGLIATLGFLCFLPYSHFIEAQRGSRIRTKQSLPNFSAFQYPSFLLVSIVLFLLEFAIFAIAGLLPTLATGAVLPAGGGYTLIVILSASSCVGRILPGLMVDVVGPFNIILAMTVLTLLFMGGLFIPFAERSRSAPYAFSALWGFCSGSFLSIPPADNLYRRHL